MRMLAEEAKKGAIIQQHNYLKNGRIMSKFTCMVIKFPTPTANNDPNDITAGHDGNLWFTEYNYSYNVGKIGRITPKGQITEFLLPRPNSNLSGITAGPDGNLWFTECVGAGKCTPQIGRITPKGQITELPVPPNSAPYSITAGPDGNLWFTDGGEIGRITPTGQITEFPTPTANSNFSIGSITAGPDGNLWFTECDFDSKGNCINSQIERITPSGQITEFLLPDSNSTVIDITTGPDDNLWFTEENFSSGTGKIGRITSGK